MTIRKAIIEVMYDEDEAEEVEYAVRKAEALLHTFLTETELGLVIHYETGLDADMGNPYVIEAFGDQ